MNRSARRHQSTKVPNVKLRPAPSKGDPRTALSEDQRARDEALRHYQELRSRHAVGKRKAAEDDEHAEDRSEGLNEDDENDECAPLAGCVICTTGFSEEKVRMQECASALGATFEGNLTDAATHLIAKEPGSDKYFWSIKMGIPILRPYWLQDLRERWQKARPIDYDALLEEHRLDAFEGLTMAMAGVTDVDRRKEVRNQVKLASGKTPTVFKLDGSFTHLLCQDIKNSETHKAVERFLHKANRYRKRGEDVPDNAPEAEQMRAALNIKMVWMEWMEDSLAVNGCIEERLYGITEPRMNKAQRERLVASILAKREDRKQWTAQRMLACRPISTSAKDEEVVSARLNNKENTGSSRPVTKRTKVPLSELVQHLTSDKKEHSPAIAAEATPTPLPELDTDTDTEDKASRSTEGVESTKESKQVKQAEIESLSDRTVSAEGDDETGKGPRIDQSLEKDLKDVIFRVDLRDESKNARVLDALRAYGVRTLLSAEDARQADFHILPLGKVDVSNAAHLGQPVTHFYVERCMIEDRALRLEESFALRPARCTFPLAGSEAIKVALTGLGSNEDGPDRHQVELALDVAGIEAESVFKRGVHTHLLVGKAGIGSQSTDAKIQRAKKWGVPIVGVEFVEKIFRHGLDDYMTSTTRVDVGDTTDISLGDVTTASASTSLLLETQANKMGVHDRRASTTWQRSSSDGERVFGEVMRPKVPSQPRTRESEPPGDLRAQQRNGGQPQPDIAVQLATHASADQMMALLGDRVWTEEAGKDEKADAGEMSRVQNLSLNGRKTRRLPPSVRQRAGRHVSRTPTLDERAPSVASELPDAGKMFGAADDRNDNISAMMLQHSMLNPFTVSPAEVTPIEESLRVVYDDPIARRERRKLAAMINNRRSQQDDDSQTDSSPQKPELDSGSQHIRHIPAPPAQDLAKARSAPDFTPSIKARKQPGTAQRDL